MAERAASASTVGELSVLRFVLVGVPMISLLYGVGRYAYGLFLPSFQQDFALSLSEAGAISGVATGIYTFLAVLFSVTATAFRPNHLIAAAGVLTACGIATVAAAHVQWLFVVGIVVASFGAGIAPPGYLQVIGRQLRHGAQNRAIAILNTGGAPGLALAAATAFFFAGEWRATWLVFGVLCAMITVANVLTIPRPRAEAPAAAAGDTAGALGVLTRLLRPGAGYVIALSFVYGVILSIYYTFAVSMVAETIAHEDVRYLFWMLIGVFGLPAMLTARYVARLGADVVVALSFFVLGLAAFILQADAVWPIVMSALAFGVFSIVPNSACLIMSHGIYGADRPSLGWGVVFGAMSLGMTVAPALAGWVADRFGLSAMFQSLAAFALLSAAGVLVTRRFGPPHAGEFHD